MKGEAMREHADAVKRGDERVDSRAANAGFFPPAPRLPSGFTLPSGRTLIMGILNVTPDSFSDGGHWSSTGAAIEHAHEMLEQGADLVDIGGESTRPNSTRITTTEEWKRIGRVLETLASQGVVCSVDTLHSDTARRAIDAGAAIINDVSGGMWDPSMNSVLAASECAYVIQHYRALPGPEENFDYGDDLIATMLKRLSEQVGAALDAGVDPAGIIVDPGLGFSLNDSQGLYVSENLGQLRTLGYPVLVGASRKRFLVALGGDRDERTAEVTERAARARMWAVRVHEIVRNAEAALKGSEEKG